MNRLSIFFFVSFFVSPALAQQQCFENLLSCLCSAGDACSASACPTCDPQFPGDGAGHGPALQYRDNGLTVTDEITGLEWEKKTPDQGGCLADLHCFKRVFTWADAQLWIAEINQEMFAGHSDWRLPHVKELQSIVRYQPGLTTVLDAVFGVHMRSQHWTSTPFRFAPDRQKMYVEFFSGWTGDQYVEDLMYVRAVRDGP